MTYTALIQELYSRTQSLGIKLGLKNCSHLHELFGSPASCFKSIHIAGTNGKGSVTVKTAAGLQAAGYRVGRYTSPHISTFRERITVNGEMISEEEVVQILTDLFALTKQAAIPATFFELTTLLALRFFADRNIDYAVIETGLGGRLDATNIIQPVISVITSISLDHTDILGQTLPEITKEKAGIIKANIPVLIGPSVPIEVIKPIAQDLKSPLMLVSEPFMNSEQENRALAHKTLEFLQVAPMHIQEGLQAYLPCRYEKIDTKPMNPSPKAVLLDAAHNPAGIKALLERIQTDYPAAPLHIVCGFSKNKDVRTCLQLLSNHSKSLHFVASSVRAISTVELHAILADFCELDAFSENTVAQAISKAVHLAALDQGVVVVCGTFYIMREARKALGIAEPSDPLVLSD